MGCVVANLAHGGITVSGSSNTVRSCDLYNLGSHGISLNGGDRKTLTPANNVAVNNHIHHYGLFKRTYAPGIGVSGCGQIVRTCMVSCSSRRWGCENWRGQLLRLRTVGHISARNTKR